MPLPSVTPFLLPDSVRQSLYRSVNEPSGCSVYNSSDPGPSASSAAADQAKAKNGSDTRPEPEIRSECETYHNPSLLNTWAKRPSSLAELLHALGRHIGP